VVVLVAALVVPAAAAAASSWRVSGSLSGTYDDSVAWDQCFGRGTGTASEHVDLDVRLRPAATSRYRRGASDFAAIAHIDVGGRWSVAGSYPPWQRDTQTCGPPIPIACGGNVTNPDASERHAAPVVFERQGRTFVGNFRSFVEVSEDKAGQPSPCSPATDDADDGSLSGRPLFGVTTAAGTLFTGLYRFPVSRLNGRRPFTISPTPNPKDADPCGQAYLSCSQSNQLTMQLTFTPVR
jgi:hypothetical protein